MIESVKTKAGIILAKAWIQEGNQQLFSLLHLQGYTCTVEGSREGSGLKDAETALNQVSYLPAQEWNKVNLLQERPRPHSLALVTTNCILIFAMFSFQNNLILRLLSSPTIQCKSSPFKNIKYKAMILSKIPPAPLWCLIQRVHQLPAKSSSAEDPRGEEWVSPFTCLPSLHHPHHECTFYAGVKLFRQLKS